MLSDLPSLTYLKSKGVFVGYWLGLYAQYYECWKLGKEVYALVDGAKNNNYFVYVEKYKGKVADLIRGCDPINGDILPKINIYNER